MNMIYLRRALIAVAAAAPRPQRLVAGGTSLASRVHRPPVGSARGKDDANRRPQRRGRVGMGSHKGDSGVAIQRGIR